MQDIEKIKVRYHRSVLFDLFEILQAVEVNKGISLDFKFRCYGNTNENRKPLSKNKRLSFPQNKKSVSPIFLQRMTLPAVTIKLYCFKLHFEHHFCLNNRPFTIIDNHFDQWLP